MENQTKPVIVYAESTPNPTTMKFVVNRMIIDPDKIAEYLSVNETRHAPMAEKLFEFGFIKSLFFSGNFITITKTNDFEWSQVTQKLREWIKEYLDAGMPVIEKYPEVRAKSETSDDPVAFASGSPEQAIHSILEEYIKPAVEQDGGAITFKSFNDGIVTVQLQGSCSGCPSSKITLKNGIETMLKRMVPGVMEVVAEDIWFRYEGLYSF